MIALVRGVMYVSICAGSMLKVLRPQSTSTGVAPACTMEWMVEQKVMAGAMTSSPGPMPSASSAR